MRLLLVNTTSARVGGIETYLEEVAQALAAQGHEVAFAAQQRGAAAQIALPAGAPVWYGPDEMTDGIAHWRPDVVYAHGALDAAMEERALTHAHACYFAHNYYGTCISGLKRRSGQACERVLGPQCLLRYLPQHCGGANPATMFHLYSRERARLERLRRYSIVFTASGHMQREYERHGFQNVRVIGLPAPAVANRVLPKGSPLRLLFLGRLEIVKGPLVLLDALELLKRPVHLTIAGAGSLREVCERRAAEMQRHNASLSVEFTGWCDAEACHSLLAQTHLLVMPSMWPEPFGKAGLEANAMGVPVVAFETGGIPEWLRPGVNGELASAHPLSAAGFADAITRCVANLDARSHGALETAAHFSMAKHLSRLQSAFDQTQAFARYA